MKTPLHSKAMRNGLYRKAHPIEAMMIRKKMGDELLGLSIACLMADDGSEQVETLARLSYLIGMGAEVARVIPVAGKNRPGLHQALQAVVDMACDGHRWDKAWAAQLSSATEISIDLFCSYKALALHFEPGARELSQAVLAGTVKANAIEPLNYPNGNEAPQPAEAAAEMA